VKDIVTVRIRRRSIRCLAPNKIHYHFIIRSSIILQRYHRYKAFYHRELVIYAVMIHQLRREPGDRLRAAEPGSLYNWCIITA